jgi:hypothetical protein
MVLSKRMAVSGALAVSMLVSLVGGFTVVRGGVASGASPLEVLAFGQQAAKSHTEFGIVTTGTGNTAKGTMSVWQGSCTEAGCTHYQLTAIAVTCVEIKGNDAVITGKTSYRGTPETVVAEAVDKSNPSTAPDRDTVRFSYTGFISPTPTPRCYKPALKPVAIASGDIRVPAS